MALLVPRRVLVVQNGFDHQGPDRQLLETDEVGGQDPVQLVDAVRRGGKPFQLLAPVFPCDHDLTRGSGGTSSPHGAGFFESLSTRWMTQRLRPSALACP